MASAPLAQPSGHRAPNRPGGWAGMLVNSNLTITGERVVLVPYRQEHVPVYHEWMVSRAVSCRPFA